MTASPPATLPFHAATPVPADVLAKLGATVAATAEGLQRGWPAMPAEAAEAVARLDGLGLQVQALARVLAGRAPAAPEAVDLGMAVLQARAAWHGELQRRGVELAGPSQGWVVQGSPGVLAQLLDLAIGHAVQFGRRIDADLVPHPQAGHAALRLTVHTGADEAFAIAPEADDGLHWDLLALLARHTGVLAQRHVQAYAVVLMLGFPTSMDAPQRPPATPRAGPAPRPAPRTDPPVPAVPAVPAVPSGPAAAVADVRALDSAPAVSAPDGAAGTLQVLLLEPHEPTRHRALDVMTRAGGVAVLAAPTVAQARAALGEAVPGCVVTGLDPSDPSVAPLLADLRARRPALRVLALAESAASPAGSSTAADPACRIARADIDRELMPALARACADA